MPRKQRIIASAQALRTAQYAAAHRLVVFSQHARTRMEQEQATTEDVLDAMRTAKCADPGDGADKWRLSGGVTEDGRELCVVVALVWNTVVVTVFSR